MFPPLYEKEKQKQKHYEFLNGDSFMVEFQEDQIVVC